MKMMEQEYSAHNSMMENFFMKTELLYLHEWASVVEFEKELRSYIHLLQPWPGQIGTKRKESGIAPDSFLLDFLC